MDEHHILGLGASRTANGGTEWCLTLDGKPIYPNSDRVGIFYSEPEKPVPEKMLKRVLDQWKRNTGIGGLELRDE